MKTMKKLTALLILILFILCFIPAHAGTFPVLTDEAGLLSEEEFADLTDLLLETAEKTGMDVIVCIPASLGDKTAQEFADDYYDDYGYAEDGVLFMFCMEERDWAISTKGEAIGAFTDYAQSVMMEEIRQDLAAGSYAEAIYQYAYCAELFVSDYRNGTPYDNAEPARGDEEFARGGATPTDYAGGRRSVDWFKNGVIALIAGFVIALVITGIMRGKLKTVRRQNAAADYVERNSLHVTESGETFLYSTVSRVPRSDNSSSGSSGGSATHVSSSGATHGGSSGKF